MGRSLRGERGNAKKEMKQGGSKWRKIKRIEKGGKGRLREERKERRRI